MKKWFESWFDTKYYHMLYGNRDDNEAQKFLSALLKERAFKSSDRILDLACGKGRHSIFLNNLGFDIVGVDLSELSINLAKKHENERLSFFIHDMLEPIENYTFDFVLNLFTSFGYFEDDKDNLKMLNSVKEYLNDDGELIIDFMNSTKVEKDLVRHEVKVVDNINFNIERQAVNGCVEKKIQFSDQGEEFIFVEKVRSFGLVDFRSMLEKTGFTIDAVFGDYELGNFNEESSDRLIICAKIK